MSSSDSAQSGDGRKLRCGGEVSCNVLKLNTFGTRRTDC
jgi:hypothetical protein